MNLLWCRFCAKIYSKIKIITIFQWNVCYVKRHLFACVLNLFFSFHNQSISFTFEFFDIAIRLFVCLCVFFRMLFPKRYLIWLMLSLIEEKRLPKKKKKANNNNNHSGYLGIITFGILSRLEIKRAINMHMTLGTQSSTFFFLLSLFPRFYAITFFLSLIRL